MGRNCTNCLSCECFGSVLVVIEFDGIKASKGDGRGIADVILGEERHKIGEFERSPW